MVTALRIQLNPEFVALWEIERTGIITREVFNSADLFTFSVTEIGKQIKKNMRLEMHPE